MNITWHFGSGLGLGFKPSSHIRLSLFFASQKSCFFACDKPSVEKKKLTIIFLASNFCEIFWSTKSAVGGFESKQQLRLFFFFSITEIFVHNLNNFSSNLNISTAAQTLFKSNDTVMTLRNQSTIFFPEFSTRTFYTTKVELWSNWKLSIGTEHYIFKKTSNTWFQDGWGAGGGDIQED